MIRRRDVVIACTALLCISGVTLLHNPKQSASDDLHQSPKTYRQSLQNLRRRSNRLDDMPPQALQTIRSLQRLFLAPSREFMQISFQQPEQVLWYRPKQKPRNLPKLQFDAPNIPPRRSRPLDHYRMLRFPAQPATVTATGVVGSNFPMAVLDRETKCKLAIWSDEGFICMMNFY